jgi:hypothetical protein
MHSRILPLIGLALLAGTVSAQQVLYENPYNAAGGADCTFTDACSTNFSGQSAQSFTLQKNSTIDAVSIIVADPFFAPTPLRYTWSIFESANGAPTGAPGPFSFPENSPTVLPFITSGPNEITQGNGVGTYSYLNLVPSKSNSSWINEVTIDTGPITLGSGTYFLALQAYGPENDYEGWAAGVNGGGADARFNVWSPTGGGSALTVIGTSAPEIDPSSAIGALTLMLGGLTVLRSRRSPLP